VKNKFGGIKSFTYICTLIKTHKAMQRKTFIFIEKNGSGTLVISAQDLDEAIQSLSDMVSDPMGWRVENEEGEIQ
jgi:hypothetical protein